MVRVRVSARVRVRVRVRVRARVRVGAQRRVVGGAVVLRVLRHEELRVRGPAPEQHELQDRVLRPQVRDLTIPQRAHERLDALPVARDRATALVVSVRVRVSLGTFFLAPIETLARGEG